MIRPTEPVVVMAVLGMVEQLSGRCEAINPEPQLMRCVVRHGEEELVTLRNLFVDFVLVSLYCRRLDLAR